MGNNWQTVKLKDIVNFNTGKLNSNAAVDGGQYPFFTCSPETLRINTHAFDCEAVLLAGNNANGVFPVKYYDGRFNAYQRTYVITPKANIELDVKWLFFQIQHVTKVLQKLSVGTATKFLTKQILDSFEVKLPPFEHQKKISNHLWSLLEKENLNRQINQTLEQMAQTLFKSWCVDFDPVVDNALDAGFFEQDIAFPDELLRRAEARRAVRERGDFKPLPDAIRQLFPAAFEECAEPSVGLGGWVPKGWRVAALDTIAEFQNGLALQKFRPDNDQVEYLPVLKISQLRQGYCDDNERARTDIKESCRVYNGDMIFSWSGTLMIDIWTGGAAALNQHLYKVTSDKYPLSFYFHWTNNHLARFQHIAAAKAVTMGHIKKGDLSESYCVVPTSHIITEFDRIVGGNMTQAKNVRLQNNTLTNLREVLLPKLISGELCLDKLDANLAQEGVA